MNKNIFNILIILGVTFNINAQTYQNKQYKATTANYSNQIQEQFVQLLQKHNQYWQNQQTAFDHFEKNFFSNVAFVNMNATHGFFTNLQQQIANGAFQGNFVMSYTNATFINGKMQSVSYTCSGNGKNAQITKTTNNNGQILKAVYDYDISHKQMKIQEYKNEKVLNLKDYQI